MTSFIKRFKNTSREEIQREGKLQRKAAAIGISPKVIRVNKQSIVMENLDEPCIADKYGANINDIPEWIKEEIVNILHTLYTMGIEYIDVTPYNFIEKDGIIYVIDFGHAHNVNDKIHYYLDEIFNTWYLEKWNEDFT